MKLVLSLVLGLFVSSAVYAGNCHQNVQRIVVDHCAQQVVANVVQPYAVVVPLEVAYSHVNFIPQQVVVDNYAQNVVVQRVRQVQRQGLVQRLQNRREAAKAVRQANRAKVVVKENVIVRQRNLANVY